MHSDGIDTNRKAPRQLDQSLTELTEVLKALGVAELHYDEQHHYHLIEDEAKPDTASLTAFSTLVWQMHKEIVKKDLPS